MITARSSFDLKRIMPEYKNLLRRYRGNIAFYTAITFVFFPLQYILSIRIYNAEALLKSNQYNVTEISSIVGYENPLYFSRIFKKVKGVSPSEYRKSINL